MTALAHLTVQGRLKHFASIFEQAHLRQELPGFSSFLHDLANPEVYLEKDDFFRRLLTVFKTAKDSPQSSDQTFDRIKERSTDLQHANLLKFVNGAPIHEVGEGFELQASHGVRQEWDSLQSMKAITLWDLYRREQAPVVKVDNDIGKSNIVHAVTEIPSPDDHSPVEAVDQAVLKSVKVFEDIRFQNWGNTVDTDPSFICLPSTVSGVVEIVKYANKHDLTVRVSGYRHSWAPVFGQAKGGIIISTVDLHDATTQLNTVSLPLALPAETELTKIELVDEAKGWVKVGSGVTNEQLRRWCNAAGKLTLPLNVIMVEITAGGANGMICHGAGRRHNTLSDLVVSLDYVDAHGMVRTISQQDDDFLLAAAGCFGLIGVITSLTLQLEPMSYAILCPVKLPVIDAIPPPDDYRSRLPPALALPRTDEQIAQAVAAFEARATNDYYAEWFWFPYSDEVWVNTWNTTDDSEGAIEYPSKPGCFEQWLESVLMEAMQYLSIYTHTDEVGPLLQTTLMSRFAMASLGPTGTTTKTQVPNALHFRRAIQEIRVRDVELEIPLLPTPSSPTTPSFDLVRRTWWTAILAIYASSPTCPARMPLEMRILGTSSSLLAAQRGNTLGTCAIEILTLESVSTDLWHGFAQGVLDAWFVEAENAGREVEKLGEEGKDMREVLGAKAHGTGEVRVRPHWAKEWTGFKGPGGVEMKKYVREVAYKREIGEFRDVLRRIGERDAWTLADVQKRFSNELFNEIIFEEEIEARAAEVGEPTKSEVLASNEVPTTTMMERLAELQTVGGVVGGS